MATSKKIAVVPTEAALKKVGMSRKSYDTVVAKAKASTAAKRTQATVAQLKLIDHLAAKHAKQNEGVDLTPTAAKKRVAASKELTKAMSVIAAVPAPKRGMAIGRADKAALRKPAPLKAHPVPQYDPKKKAITQEFEVYLAATLADLLLSILSGVKNATVQADVNSRNIGFIGVRNSRNRLIAKIVTKLDGKA